MASNFIARMFERRKMEVLITSVLLLFSGGVIFWSLGLGSSSGVAQVGEKLAFATLVALFVRWISVLFSEADESRKSSRSEYESAIANARGRIWISQTWFPGVDLEARRIIESSAPSVRVLLGSFDPRSAIHSRILGRKISAAEAKALIANSVKDLVPLSRDRMSIRFCHGYRPGWIAIIDSAVFWGATPVDRDAHSKDFLFHRVSDRSDEGRFWISQFETLYSESFSHSHRDELAHNASLPAPLETA